MLSNILFEFLEKKKICIHIIFAQNKASIKLIFQAELLANEKVTNWTHNSTDTEFLIFIDSLCRLFENSDSIN